MIKRAATALLVVLLLAAGMLLQSRMEEAERSAALKAALTCEEALKAYAKKVEPLVEQGARTIVLVYLDPASPPEARLYVVEWLDPRTLYLTSLLKVRVRVAGGAAAVVEVDP